MANITAKCPKCGRIKQLQVVPQPGSLLRCFECGTRFAYQLPTVSDIRDDPCDLGDETRMLSADQIAEGLASLDARKRRASLARQLQLTLVLIVVVSLLASAAAYWLARSPKQPDSERKANHRINGLLLELA